MDKEIKEDRFWYLRTTKEVLEELETSQKGLDDEQAKKREETYGKNSIAHEDKYRVFRIFLKNVNNVLIYILCAAAFISYSLHEMIEFYALVIIVLLTIILGFIQEYSADKTIKALSKLSAKKIMVIRGNVKKEILSEDLVPGDIVILRRGIISPADIRVIESRGLIVDEAILTGESVPKAKSINALKHQDTPLAERDNMIFAGTSISAGDGLGVVVETGLHSEIGKISQTILSLKEQKSPLQEKIEGMSRQISFMIIAISVVLFLILLYKGSPFSTAILLVGAVAVAGIPESFPLAMTLTLSKGVKRMAQKHALVKNLNSVETLGTTTVICTDKTGTLTENKMKVVRFIHSSEKEFDVQGKTYEPNHIFSHDKKTIDKKVFGQFPDFFNASIICNGSDLEFSQNEWRLVGEATEGAILTLAKSAGYDDVVIREQNKIIHEIPFDPANKFMISVTKDKKNNETAYLKGASEKVLGKCSYMRDSKNKKIALDKKKRDFFEKKIHEYSSMGLRTLAIASKSVSGKDYKRQLENNFILEGIVAIEDPIREDVYKAIEDCQSSGIRVIMITGDHKSTAQSIAQRLKLVKDNQIVMEGAELENMSDEELDNIINNVAVFARTSPEHKFKIVSSLQRKGEIVAMTGDGVNDAPALKKADIGISMGLNGTEVAREASDMILTDDNFSTIVHAIREGRTIYSNIRRFIYYLLSVNFAQVGIIIMAVILGFINLLPLTPLMILYINIITSTFPALALSVEPTHEKVMKQKPRDPKEKILSRYILMKTFLVFPIMLFSALILFFWEMQINGNSYEKAMTIAFLVMVFSGTLHTFNARSLHTSIIDKGFFKNPYVFLSVAFSSLLTMTLVYTEIGQQVFGLVPILATDWFMILLFSASAVLFAEVIKLSIKSEFEEQSSLRGIKMYLE